MSLNATVSAERPHIGFFGLRNAGKSSLVNTVTGQALSVVSEVKGTTTDPVKKAMELLPLGPVVIIDTPGLDDEGELGAMRVEKARQVLAQTDIAVLVADSARTLTAPENELVSLFEEKKLPYIIALNKADLLPVRRPLPEKGLYVSALTGEGVGELKEKLGALLKTEKNEKRIVADLLSPGDLVVLVMPIDEAAPKGRLILPQQQTMRDILDARCAFAACQPEELKGLLAGLGKKPRLIITDSQAFGRVAKDTPEDVQLTSFSILFARYKGDLETLVQGAAKLKSLQDGHKVLISEGCTHHRQCGDIGTVKLPGWIREFSGAEPEFHFTSGGEFPEDLHQYALIVHCGGCMLNEKEMQHRLACAQQAGVPMVNYGVAIAQIHGILKRSLAPFPALQALV
ncbi:[FeFe] hydrogenase H-cluster maturation GTPase HydF [Neglecta sp. X4]|uniref:[FeFe] hydrogenase H-cluster maturation GTPase HydF n=1 Tax=unclassified Neglectibacter TaxID=2632164 RepID=UPI0013681164|nr:MULTISPECIES: [FeFe] hydrogenase H-cluster maturation GTPase HydF [unclassified Neglectibacter]NBI18261.1 [FeFe] hydrogenase H-cluster maturation GTPase HydF [Neglectibacter sp. 59]NBJ73972.1 [FeFe] hydrogenase H-cluster maturation GTPase HydF [Neglectibacter sp. X4]NCE81811.1 [FeFe] hydrogenase H-cluster maturation GTPase HydF [Neglectibacter sp. X58]